MKFDATLKQGVLIQRYKRFLADVETENGIVTMHCPNTGSMKNCAEPGFKVWYSTSSNPKRKYPNTWEVAENFDGHRIGINTGNANKLVAEALEKNVIVELAGYDSIRKEVKYGEEKSRIDFLLSGDSTPDCYVEVKSVTLLDAGRGFFPDAVSERGRKHLRELMAMVGEGFRAVLLYCVQHTGIETVQAAESIDPAYSKTLHEAIRSGVEVLAYGSDISDETMTLSRTLKFVDR